MADLWSTSLQRLVDRIAGGEIGESAFKKSVFLDRQFKSRKVRSGERIETPLITGNDGYATMFTVYSTNDGSGTVGGASGVTYVEPDKHLNLVSDWKPGGSQIRLSKIKLAQASGMKDRLYDYLESQVKVTINSVKELIGNQIINGNPNSTATDMNGLEHIFDNDGTYFSQTRTGSDALFGTEFVATSTGSDYTTGTLSGTISTRTVTGSGTAWTSNASAGDKLEISGDSTIYTIRAVVSDTSLYITPKLTAAASGASYTITRAFANTTEFGVSGGTTYEKLNEVYYACTDGGDAPTLALANSRRFAKVVNAMVANQRYMGRSNEVGISGDSFMFNNAKFVIDNYVNSAKIYLINEDYWQTFALTGFDSFTLDKASLKDNQDSTRRASLTGELNVVLATVCQAANRQGLLSGLTD